MKFFLGWMSVRVVASWILSKHHRHPLGYGTASVPCFEITKKSEAHGPSPRFSPPPKMPLTNKMRHPDMVLTLVLI